MNHDQQKQRVNHLLQSASTIARARQQGEIEGRLAKAAERLAEGKLIVVVCGEYKQGKSKLINALLGEKDLFPVDVDIATCLVSTITHGAKERVQIISGEQGSEKATQIARAEITDYVTEQRNPGNVKNVRLLVIESPNRKLENGLTLVDTPGVGSLNQRHTEVTYAFLPMADVVVFVSDASRPLTQNDLHFIRDRIWPHCDRIIFLVTKKDTNREYATIVENNRGKLAATLGLPGPGITVLPVSSNAKMRHSVSGHPEDLTDSNFEALESEIWRLLNEQRAGILLLRALTSIGKAVAELRQPLQAEWQACQGQERSKKLEREYEAAKEHRDRLLENDAAWRTQLSDGLVDIRSRVQNNFQTGLARIKTKVNAMLDDPQQLQGEPAQMVARLEADIQNLTTTAGSELSREAAELHGRLQFATGLDLNPFEMSSLDFEKAHVGASADTRKAGWWDKALRVTRMGSFTATAGMTLCGVLGSAVGGAIGFFAGGIGAYPGALIGAKIGGAIGSIAGFGSGAKEAISQIGDRETAERRRALAGVLLPYLDESQRACARALSEALKDLERSMRDELVAQLKRAKATAESSLLSVQSTQKLSHEQAVRHAAALKAPLAELDKLAAEAERMVREISQYARLSAPAAAPAKVASPMGEPIGV